jgi:sporulation protein YlmC with PRC-barrel domain
MHRFIDGEDRMQQTLLPNSLEDYVSEENPVRVIEAFIDELDLAALGFAGMTPAATGRPAYHPSTLLKIYLYGYLNRVQSSRRLERETQRNIEPMWISPHSALCLAIDALELEAVAAAQTTDSNCHTIFPVLHLPDCERIRMSSRWQGSQCSAQNAAVSLKNERTAQTMKTIISATLLAMSLSTAALAQAPMSAGSAEIFTRLPVGTSVTNFYKQNVYDPSDNKIGDVEDVLIDKEGRVTAMIIGVGGFLGMGEKDVAVPFSSVSASEKSNKWYLVLNTNKEALKAAPGFTYDTTKTTWTPAVK